MHVRNGQLFDLLYRQSVTGYELILEDASGLGLELLKTSSNGYTDLSVDARETAATTVAARYTNLMANSIAKRSSTIVKLKPAKAKPASRRRAIQTR